MRLQHPAEALCFIGSEGGPPLQLARQRLHRHVGQTRHRRQLEHRSKCSQTFQACVR